MTSINKSWMTSPAAVESPAFAGMTSKDESGMTDPPANETPASTEITSNHFRANNE